MTRAYTYISTTDFINRSKKAHGDLYDYSKSVYVNPQTKIEIICSIHGSFFQSPFHHMRGRKCKYCAHHIKFLKTEDFIKQAKEVHKNKYDYSKTILNGSNKIKIICPVHGEFEQYVGHHINGCGCKLCQTKFGIKNIKEFVKKAKQIHGNRYNYNKTIFISAASKVKIICKLHGEFEVNSTAHLMGVGCRECHLEKFSQSRVMSKEEFIKRAKEIHGNKYDYSKVQRVKGMKWIRIICPKHGEFLQRIGNHLGGFGCSLCKASKGELAIEKFLKTNNIKYKSQFRFKQCRDKNTLPFDFYLPEFNTCIEYDGQQHFSKDTSFKGDLEITKYHDDIKTNFCKMNNIKMVRIPYWEKNNINSILTKCLNLNI